MHVQHRCRAELVTLKQENNPLIDRLQNRVECKVGRNLGFTMWQTLTNFDPEMDSVSSGSVLEVFWGYS